MALAAFKFTQWHELALADSEWWLIIIMSHPSEMWTPARGLIDSVAAVRVRLARGAMCHRDGARCLACVSNLNLKLGIIQRPRPMQTCSAGASGSESCSYALQTRGRWLIRAHLASPPFKLK